HGDRVLRITFFSVGSLQCDPQHSLRGPQFLREEVEFCVADVQNLVRLRRSAAPVKGNQPGRSDSGRSAMMRSGIIQPAQDTHSESGFLLCGSLGWLWV